MGAAGRESGDQALDRPFIDGLLAGAICAERLCKNIDSVSVGGNSRSRWAGKANSVASKASGPVNRLKNACASTHPAFAEIA